MSNQTGYGTQPRGRWDGLMFDGDEDKYEMWELKLLAYMKIKKLKTTILPGQDPPDPDKNETAFAELIQFLDDRSLGLIMREGVDDGRKSLAILREHYAGIGKPRIILLYTTLTSLVKNMNESLTDYIIRAETASSSLKTAGEIISDSLLIAMVLKGLPTDYKPFNVFINQSDKVITFGEFKVALRNFEENERVTADGDRNSSVMSMNNVTRYPQRPPTNITCYTCGVLGHKSNQCDKKKWCNYCRSSTHSHRNCRKQSNTKERDDEAANMVRDNEFHSYAFQIQDHSGDHLQGVANSLLVDCGATSHIMTDEAYFISFEKSFNPESHYISLADGSMANNVALKRGTVSVVFVNTKGDPCHITLENVLFIPTYPQNIFSVQAATQKGSSVNFYSTSAELVTSDGCTFDIKKEGRLYYLNCFLTNHVNVTRDLEMWHQVLGHCNKEDVLKLEKVVNGMNINSKEEFICEPCILGKQIQTKSTTPANRATRPLEFVCTDVCGPIQPTSNNGFRYLISFVDNYSGYVFLYFIKRKSDATKALQKFLADVSPIGKVSNLLDLVPSDNVTKLRSDNGGEYMGELFKQVLLDNQIKHEQCCPYSPHQNGIAERGWRTLLDMGRCLLIDAKLPKEMWPYALMTAAYTRNRCYQQRTQQTPYYMLTGRKPNLEKMHLFGSICYSYQQNKSKLDPRSKRGVFVGYDKESPAYLVYFPESKKVVRCRSVKFTDVFTIPVVDENATPSVDPAIAEKIDVEFAENEVPVVNNLPAEENVIAEDPLNETIPYEENKDVPIVPVKRTRNKPKHLEDYVSASIDYCCAMVNCDIPKTYTEAMESPESPQWERAMESEMKSLIENETFSSVPQSDTIKTVGGRWVYSIKDGPNNEEIFKARYVAKGYSQVFGKDYFDTFAPTAKMASVRALMQVAAQNDFLIHQMDVKTAYLNAPVDCEIYLDPPEGYKQKNLIWKLNKSIYGLKQSGRMWNNVIHQFFIDSQFTRSLADPCVYFRTVDHSAIILIWVDDIIISTDSIIEMDKIKDRLKNQFKMKDLGPINTFLGIQVKQMDGCIQLDQSRYLTKLLQRFDMSDCKSRHTPCEQKPSSMDTAKTPEESPRRYREIVGTLVYAMICTRPDLSWVVTKLSQHLDKPDVSDWIMLTHVLRYVKGSVNQKLIYCKTSCDLSLVGFSDSDWGGSESDRRSTTGYYFSLSHEGPPISWKTRKQPTVALSSCEAEYMALALTVQEAIFLSILLKDFLNEEIDNVLINADNQGAIALVKNPIIQNRSKHIDIKYHFVREKFEAGFINLAYVSSEDNVADMMTKPFTKVKIDRFRKLLFG